MICKIVRRNKGVVGFPSIVIPFLAAKIISYGNIIISSNAKPIVAIFEVNGISKPIAPIISKYSRNRHHELSVWHTRRYQF